MYNIRYHLVSLVSVFIALALGLVLGSVVAERGYLDEQQSALIDSLRKDFGELRADNEALVAESERMSGFSQSLAEVFTAGMLDGARVLVVTNTGRTDGLAAVQAAVTDSGGEVVTAVLPEPGLGSADDAVIAAAVEATDSVQAEPSADERLGLVADVLASELVAASDVETLAAALGEAGHVEFQGHEAQLPITAVVVMSAFDGEPDPGALALATAFDRLGIPALAAETSWGQEGLAQAGVEAGVSAVNAVDLPEGKLSLVMILAGRAEGFFGVGEGAPSLYPELSEAPSG